MMTSCACYEKAEMCDVSAAASPDADMRAAWLSMGAHWRALGRDGEGQLIVAWLLSGAHGVD